MIYNILSFLKYFTGITFLIFSQCYMPFVRSDLDYTPWSMAAVYLCENDSLNFITISFSQTAVSKFVLQCKEYDSQNIIKEKEIVINNKQKEYMRANLYDTIPCIKNVYYEIYGIDSLNNKINVQVNHFINLKMKSKYNK